MNAVNKQFSPFRKISEHAQVINISCADICIYKFISANDASLRRGRPRYGVRRIALCKCVITPVKHRSNTRFQPYVWKDTILKLRKIRKVDKISHNNV